MRPLERVDEVQALVRDLEIWIRRFMMRCGYTAKFGPRNRKRDSRRPERRALVVRRRDVSNADYDATCRIHGSGRF